jgi:hypothetical protein
MEVMFITRGTDMLQVIRTTELVAGSVDSIGSVGAATHTHTHTHTMNKEEYF